MNVLVLLLGLTPALLVRALYEGLPSDARQRSGALLGLGALFVAWMSRTSTLPDSPVEFTMALVVLALASGLTWRIPSRLRTWTTDLGEGILLLLALLTVLLDGDRHRLAVHAISTLILGWTLLGVLGALRGRDGTPQPLTTIVLGLSVVPALSLLLLGMHSDLAELGPPLAIAMTTAIAALGLAIEVRPDPRLLRVVSIQAIVGGGAIGGSMLLTGSTSDGGMILPMTMGALLASWWPARDPHPPLPSDEQEPSTSDSLGVERETLVVLERLADPLASADDEILPSLGHVFPGARMELLRSPRVSPAAAGSSPPVDPELLAVVGRMGLLRTDSVDALSGRIRSRLRGFGRNAVLLPVAYDKTLYGVLVVKGLELREGTFTALRRFADLLGHRLETQRLYAALQDRQRLADLGTFAAALAHDLRSPLATARLEAELLESAVGANEQESLQHIIRAIDRVLDDLSGTLDFTRALDLDIAVVDLRALLTEVVESYQIQIGPGRVTLHASEELPVVELRGDRARLLRVFENLIRNGLEVSTSDSPVRVELEREDDGIVIRVVDRGAGIDPEVRDRIFEPFVTTKAEGVGLGLAIVRKVVQAHRGRIEAHAAPGGGTSMEVWLPFTKSARQISEASP